MPREIDWGLVWIIFVVVAWVTTTVINENQHSQTKRETYKAAYQAGYNAGFVAGVRSHK